MHSSDNLKARGPTTTAAMIPTRTHPPPITAITNPPIFPQNPLARRQANDPRLCGYINGDPASSIKCSGQFGCALEFFENLPVFACCGSNACQDLAVTCVDAATNMCTAESNSIYCSIYSSMGLILSCPTACVTHALQPTGTQVDAFTSWSCGDAPGVVTVLQTTAKGAVAVASPAGGSKAGGGGTGSSSKVTGGSGSTDGNADASSAQGAGTGGGGPSSTVANIGIIAGVILGVLLLLGLAGCLFWRYRRTKRRREEQRVRHEAHTKAFKLRDEPGGNSEALMGSTQTMTWLMNQQGDDRMTVIL